MQTFPPLIIEADWDPNERQRDCIPLPNDGWERREAVKRAAGKKTGIEAVADEWEDKKGCMREEDEKHFAKIEQH